jgi:hypothetical protein
MILQKEQDRNDWSGAKANGIWNCGGIGIWNL